MLQREFSRPRSHRLSRRFVPAMLGAGFMAVVGAKAVFAADATDRSMAFVEKSVEATNLYNQRKLPEALAMFQELTQKYPDLDEDGYVMMGLADCLHALGRNDEARAAYQSVAARHVDQKETALSRIRELEVAGVQITDALIKELQQAAAAAGDNQISAQLQLGRALQKRAAALLKEAVTAFRSAGEKSRDIGAAGQQTIAEQAAVLAEIHEDLASLVDRVDKTWGGMRTLGEIARSTSPDGGGANIADYRAEWTTVAGGDKRSSIQVSWSKGQTAPRIVVDGRIIPVNSTQARVLQRYQERMLAVLQETIQTDQAQAERPK
jgi:tetratricopeptide (TPR) repeat protein